MIKFRLPEKKDRQLALGKLEEVLYQNIYEIIENKFDPMTNPSKGDWLTEHVEYGQSVKAYTMGIHNWINNEFTRKVIYILPLDKEINGEFIDVFQNICSSFFVGVKIKILENLDLNKMEIENRINTSSNKIQFNAVIILDKLKILLEKDAFCLIGVTMNDIYPKDSWNYVFGLASLNERIGIFSFARYSNEFYDVEINIKNKEKDKFNVIYRSSKVMIHEIGHMFGLKHCIYYKCIMNGSNNLTENLQKPSNLCAICLRKLQLNIGFSIFERYQSLANCYKKYIHIFEKEFIFIEKVLNDILVFEKEEKNLYWEKNKKKIKKVYPKIENFLPKKYKKKIGKIENF